MRLHSNIITSDTIHAMLAVEKAAGRIHHAVHADVSEHGSRSRARGIELALICYEYEPNTGRRRPAGYSRNWNSGTWAATYDEWGWLLSRLYEIDPDLICGSVKHPNYADVDDFDRKTGFTYAPLTMLQLDYGDTVYVYDEAPFVHRTAIRKDGKPKIARSGFGRIHEDVDTFDAIERGLSCGWLVESPRTVADVVQLAVLPMHAVPAMIRSRGNSPTNRPRRLPASSLADAYALGDIEEFAGQHVRRSDDRVLGVTGMIVPGQRMVRTVGRDGRPQLSRYDDEGRLTDLGGAPLGELHARSADSPATYDEAVRERASFDPATRRWVRADSLPCDPEPLVGSITGRRYRAPFHAHEAGETAQFQPRREYNPDMAFYGASDEVTA